MTTRIIVLQVDEFSMPENIKAVVISDVISNTIMIWDLVFSLLNIIFTIKNEKIKIIFPN